MGSGSAENDLLTVDTVAAIFGVVRSTVYNWANAGTLQRFGTDDNGELVFRNEEVLRAPVLRRRDVHERGVEPSLLDRAVRQRLVTPVRGRFSLIDVETLTRLAGPPAASPSAPAVPKRRQSGVIRKVFVWTEQDEIAWVARGADPYELPAEYFNMPSPPRLVAPVDVFRYTRGLPVEGRVGYWFVQRSEGYEWSDGKLVCCEHRARFDVVRGDEFKQTWVESNRRYRIAKERWKRVWASHWYGARGA
jgi:hypothetical protein